jgi:hypothetical protein
MDSIGGEADERAHQVGEEHRGRPASPLAHHKAIVISAFLSLPAMASVLRRLINAERWRRWPKATGSENHPKAAKAA